MVIDYCEDLVIERWANPVPQPIGYIPLDQYVNFLRRPADLSPNIFHWSEDTKRFGLGKLFLALPNLAASGEGRKRTL